MANTEKNKAPGDVEIGNVQTPAPGQPAPPNVLEQARLGNLDLFHTELESGNHPLDFKAGRGVYFNRTPLHLAAMEGHEEIAEFILSRPEISREVVNAKDRFGYTPLHLAARHSHESVVQLLMTSSLVLPDRFLAATSEPDDLGEDHGGCTPLHFAAERGHIAIAKLLLRQPCQVMFAYDPVNLQAVTWAGRTPLDIAQERCYRGPSEISFLHGLRVYFDRAQHENYMNLVRLLKISDRNWLQNLRERTAMSANAILVVSALVVAASFGSWLQPPGGIPVPDSAFGNADKYWNSVFYVCLTFAFTFSVVALVIGTLVTFPFRAMSLVDEVNQLEGAVGIAHFCLRTAVLILLLCFSFAGSIVLSNFPAIYGTKTYYVVTWLPFIAYVYLLYFFNTWGFKMRGPAYGMTMRVKMLCVALFYGLAFAVTRFIKK